MKRIAFLSIILLSFASANAQTDRSGIVAQIKGNEIIVKNEDPNSPFVAGEILKLLTGDKSVILEVVFPMQTSAKCKLVSGSLSALKVGRIVYSGGLPAKEVSKQDAIPAKQSSANSDTNHDIKINPANGHKYFLTKRDTWDEAEKEAVDAGGHLVTIRSSDEEDWLRDTFGKSEHFWIGLTRTHSMWGYEWISGEKVIYTNWEFGQPDNWQGQENVVEMNFRNAQDNNLGNKWNDTRQNNMIRGIAEIAN